MKKVFFYGDSNTYGYDPSFYTGGRYPRKERWTTLLAESLDGMWEVAVDGMPGRMIPGAGRGTSMVLDSLRSEMPVDLLAIMLGTNDLLSMRHPDASAVAAKMDNLTGSAKEELSADILLIAPPRIRFTDPSCTEPFVQGTEMYERECLEQSAPLARYIERSRPVMALSMRMRRRGSWNWPLTECICRRQEMQCLQKSWKR